MKTINCPKSWADIKLADYLQFYRSIKPYIGTEEYTEKIPLFAIFSFTDISEEEYRDLPESVLTDIQTNLFNLLSNTQLSTIKSFQIEDKKYGFIPSFDDMSYGEYLDLVTYSKKDMWSNIPIIMSILYRPITKTLGKMYEIEKYKGTSEETLALFSDALTMDIVFGATSFFLRLQNDLLIATLTYSVDQMKKIQDPKVLAALKDLETNGPIITQLQSYLTMTSQNLTQLQS
jgi:hypothetical protein